MTEEQVETMPPEELAIELMTSGQRLTGGRNEALRLLAELQRRWSQEIANIQRNAHDELRPYFHAGEPCRREFNCHVSKVIDLAGVKGEDVVHGCPPEGSGLTACCKRTPFELPRSERMTRDADGVICKRVI